MTEVLLVIAVALSVWRVTSLIVNEEGPLDMFVSLRRLLGVKIDDMNRSIGYSNPLGKMLLCLWCTSIWVAIPFALLLLYLYPVAALHPVVLFFIYDFALSAFAILTERLTH